jgi:uncharacterized protein (TIGR03084 family)
MQQASDFLAESEALEQLIAPLQANDFAHPTGFKSWTFETIMRHLHFWNYMANLALTAPDDFQAALKPAVEAMMAGKTLPDIELVKFPEEGLEVAAAYQQADPSDRVSWVGPSMSARSSITARQMETWAHGQAIADELGVERSEDDRIRNIVVLGVNTFGWSFAVRGMEVPEETPALRLTSPSGESWEYGNLDSDQVIRGMAHEFAQVVTQTRNIGDTQLTCEGDTAELWMRNAQCFAGAAAEPPAPGVRRTKSPA